MWSRREGKTEDLGLALEEKKKKRISMKRKEVNRQCLDVEDKNLMSNHPVKVLSIGLSLVEAG